MLQGVNLGVCNVHVPLLEGIELAGKHGFKGLDMGAKDVLETGVEKVREALKKYDLQYSGFNIPGVYKDPDEAVFKEGAEQLKREAEAVSKLGGKTGIMWIIPSQDERTYEQEFEFISNRMRVYAGILKDNGINLALEFIGPVAARKRGRYEFVHNIPQMLELCKAIGTGNCGLLLDAHHAYTAGHDMKDVYDLKKDQIKLVHVNDARPGVPREELTDNPRCLPGESGVIDIKTFMDALKTIGYEGFVEAEPFSEKLGAMTDPDEILNEVKKSMDGIWPL